MSFKVEQLACGYHHREIVHPLDFALQPGDGLALLGPNGSGKTTLLKTLIGLLPPLQGQVSYAGLTYAAPAKHPTNDWVKKIAFVPQEEAVAFPFTVRQIVMMGRLPHSPGFTDTEEDRSLVEAAMVRADCAPYADRPITELSGGEKQRAFIARALAQLGGPGVLLMDEPSTHLDFRHQAMLVRLLRELREEGMIVLAAWHDLQLSSASCNEALLFVEGTVEYQGPIADFMEPARLQTAFQAEFDLIATPRLKL